MKMIMLCLGFWFAALSVWAEPFDWEVGKENGRQYVPLDRMRAFYGFASLKTEEGKIEIQRKGIILNFEVGAKLATLNRVPCNLRYPVSEVGGKVSLSLRDLVEMIDPILRPRVQEWGAVFDTVVIDSGGDPKVGDESGQELQVAQELKRKLLKLGLKVVLTRIDDDAVALSKRIKIANKYPKAIFISLHFRKPAKEGVRGIQSYALASDGKAWAKPLGFLKKNAAPVDERAKIAGANAFSCAAHWGVVTTLNKSGFTMKDQGFGFDFAGKFAGLKMPGVEVLVEMSDDAQDPKFVEAVAQALSQSVKFYRQVLKKG